MKQPLGLIGLTYLCVLAVVFYLKSSLILVAVMLVSLLLILSATALHIINKIRTSKKQFKHKNSLIAIGLSALCACIALVLHTNLIYTPIVENFANKNLNFTGYVCDEVIRTKNKCTFTIQTETINDKPEKLKIEVVFYNNKKIDAFDCVYGTICPTKDVNNSLISKKTYLIAYEDEDLKITPTGEKHFSMYRYAVQLRKTLKASIKTLLPENYSSLCNAVFLGDKASLSYDIKNLFSNTGSSFLIVVSGFHIAIVVSFVKYIVEALTKKSRKKIVITCFAIFLTVFIFMAVTGFTPSVVRSGISTIIAHCATLLYRKSNWINSLGLSAIALTIGNPYSVGDVGLLLSFSATLGIILWRKPIYEYLVSLFNLKKSSEKPSQAVSADGLIYSNSPAPKHSQAISNIARSAINLISVSISASLWVIPITTLAFGTISPFVVLVSFLVEPAVTLLLICTMIASIIYLIPFISFFAYPFALACGLLSKYILYVIGFFASIPYANVGSDDIYFLIWLGITFALVIIGYAIKAKSLYIKSAITFSLASLLIGWAIFTIIDSNKAYLEVYCVGKGVTATVKSGNDISFISCGGATEKLNKIIYALDDDFINIDNIIIPNTKNKYAKYQYRLVNEFDVSNILIYDKDSNEHNVISEYDGKGRAIFGENIKFTINLTKNTSDTVLNIDGDTYQIIKSEETTILFIPENADAQNLPKEYRNADYILTDSTPKNYNLLKCKKLIFSGTDEQYIKKQKELSAISNDITTTIAGNVKIPLN